jgi:hypothetical protein
MAQVNKIDSNVTGLAYSEEESIGVLGTPDWRSLAPNSYTDFGGEIVTVAPNPINPDRQREKGQTTDLNAGGAFNHDVTFYNLKHILQGLMFADEIPTGAQVVTAVDVDTTNEDEYEVADTDGFVVGNLIKGVGFSNPENNALNVVAAVVADTSVEVEDGQLVDETPPAGAYIKVVGLQGEAGDLDVDVSGAYATIVSSSLDFEDFGLIPGQLIWIGGDDAGTSFTNAVNNGLKRIRSIDTNALVLDKSAADMVTEANAAGTIQIFFGDTLKNELGANIVRRTYQLERTLGVPDDAEPSEVQSELLTGQVFNQFVLNIPTAALLQSDLTFVGLDNLQRTGDTGPLQSSVDDPESADVFNTSSDVTSIKMAIVSESDEAPDALFAYLTDFTLTISNNATVNKAVGVLGGFEVTAGNFQVSGQATAYFGNVTAVQAVRNNSDVTLDMFLAKENRGIGIDIPLISLGDGRLNVEVDSPITLPLAIDAARGRKVATALDHTIMFNFFHYLPDAAE